MDDIFINSSYLCFHKCSYCYSLKHIQNAKVLISIKIINFKYSRYSDGLSACLCLLVKFLTRNQTIIGVCIVNMNVELRKLIYHSKWIILKNYGTLGIHYTLEKTCKTQKIFLFIVLEIFFSQRMLNTPTLPWMFYTPYHLMSALNPWCHFLFFKYLHSFDIWVKVTFIANIHLFIKDTKLVWHDVLGKQYLNFTGNWKRRFRAQG